MEMSGVLLTLNAGSSSLKASLFEIDGAVPRLALKAEVESIGAAPRFTAREPSGRVVHDRVWANEEPSFEALLDSVIAWAESHLGASALAAVGHRVVHGGRDHFRPERVTPDLLAALGRLVPLAPLHQPQNLAPIRAIAALRPGVPQVACFDTGFHASLPPVATWFGLPRAYGDAGVRRYGFHGLSYEFVARRLGELAPDLAAGPVIAAHLGAGASLCAMRGGRSLDTTMGFTALDGLMMGSRCGNIDPGVILYMQREDHLTTDEVETILYQRSGLLGVSGLTGDMRALLASDDPHAAEAVELYVYRIAREVGALVSSLGGLDGLVFTGGVGEHAAPIRSRVCARLAWLGIALDEAANASSAPVISAASSRIAVRVIPTDEEMTIARHTLETLAA
jgi:acetate kinase